LMRVKMKDVGTESDLWFFTTTVGKQKYVSLLLGSSSQEMRDFAKEGEFAKWKKEAKKTFFVCQFTRDGNEMKLDCGNNNTFDKLMSDAKIPGDGSKPVEFFNPPAEWFEKTGPVKVFDGTNYLALKREKK
jgi:hypothetical protein